MPNFDPKNYGWTQFFYNDAPQVVFPEQLTRKWWDKKKQVIAKTHATGIGELLDELPGLLGACDLARFPGNPAALDNAVEKMEAFIKSAQLKKLRDKLKEVRDTAKTEAVHYKKGALTKKTGEVLDEIQSVADSLWICINGASLSTLYDQARQAYEKEQLAKAKKNAGPTVGAAKDVAKKIDARLKTINDYVEQYKTSPTTPIKLQSGTVPVSNALGDAIRTLCRDMTQPMGNLLKAHKAEAALKNFDDAAITKLNTTVSKISNTKDPGEFMDSMTATKIGGLVKLVESWTVTFKQLVKDIALGV